jgi:hypothetical protein
MIRVKRLVVFALAAMMVPLLIGGEATAGGGFFPSLPSEFGFVYNPNANFTAIIVLDPNGPVSTGAPATLTGTFGTIAITRAGTGTAVSAFQVQPGSSLGELRFGCNLNITNPRFVEFSPGVNGLPLGGPGTFGNWLATDVTLKLFNQLGVTLVDQTQTIQLIPGVTGVVRQICAPFPKRNHVLSAVPLSEIVDKLPITPLPPTYPDLTIPGNPDPTQQWFEGFLVLQVSVGFWAHPGTPLP